MIQYKCMIVNCTNKMGTMYKIKPQRENAPVKTNAWFRAQSCCFWKNTVNQWISFTRTYLFSSSLFLLLCFCFPHDGCSQLIIPHVFIFSLDFTATSLHSALRQIILYSMPVSQSCRTCCSLLMCLSKNWTAHSGSDLWHGTWLLLLDIYMF